MRVLSFNAPPEFAKSIKQSEKYEAWLKWQKSFDVALSIYASTPSHQQKVALLYTYVGDEVRDIISMLALPPMNEKGSLPPLNEYAALKDGLNDYFRTMVDEATKYSRFIARKQLPEEAVHQFAVKHAT